MLIEELKSKGQQISRGLVAAMETIKDKTRETINEINTSINEQKPTVGYRFRSRTQPHEWVLCDVRSYETLKKNPDFEFEELITR